MTDRYNRQIILPEVGQTGQAALAKAHVLVVGVGGLAAPALPYLIGAGVGHLTLVDGDFVSLSNLHRQTLFRESDEGQPKADVAARHLRQLNGECEIISNPYRLTPDNTPALVGQSTVVLDCADSFAVSYILSDACCAADVPLISASALGFTGYVGGFCGTAPSLRAVFPDLPERAASCATAGVMGPVVGMLGAAQAQMALSVLLSMQPSPLGQLLRFDMHALRSSGFRFDGAEEPAQTLSFISPAAIQPDDYVVELRDTHEAPKPVHPDAHRNTVAGITATQPTPETGQRTVFACRSGLRAWQAATAMRSYWSGDISLIAMGDPPTSERPNT